MDIIYHTLLPNYVQDGLRQAQQDGGLAAIDKYTQAVQQALPNKFHSLDTLMTRVFWDEPNTSTKGCPRAGFVKSLENRRKEWMK